MGDRKKLSASVTLCQFSTAAMYALLPKAQTPLTTLQGDQGGMIVYGQVDEATTPAAAMAHILRIMQNNCGEKPQVGRSE